MPSVITIRPVTSDDFPQWRALWDGYNAFYGRAGSTALPEVITQA
ncbi:MAG: GNAT family N-acetyltransferase, partial [Alphaproteobacteria bacterium]